MLHYFATNRAMDRLGRAEKTKGGWKTLARRGYYFVDMIKYMDYYLGTTEADEMPHSAVVQDSEQEVFGKFLDDPLIGRVVVCVHGFNVELFEAFTWFRILTDTMKHLPAFTDRIVTSPDELAARSGAPLGSQTAFIGFSWPSNGNVLSYLSDQREAIGSKSAFASLLAQLRKENRSVSLICHSMGNYLACNALAAVVTGEVNPRSPAKQKWFDDVLNPEKKTKDYFIDNFVMIAPDVERRHVTVSSSDVVETDYLGPFHAGLEHLVNRKINVYSRFDTVLTISDVEKMPREAGLALGDVLSTVSLGLLDFLKRNPDQKWEKRLGEAPAPPNAATRFSSVNATEIAGRKIGHSDHVDAQPIVERIAQDLAI